MFTDKTFRNHYGLYQWRDRPGSSARGQDPEVAYRRACEDNAGNSPIKTLALAQVLKVNYPSAIAKCRVLHTYNRADKLHWDIKCSVCDNESTITVKEGWMVQNPCVGLPKHCSNCGVKFTGWGN